MIMGFWKHLIVKSLMVSVTDEIEYLSAIEEGRLYIAQANAPLDDRR